MRKTYQKTAADTPEVAVPDTVSVAMAELAGQLRPGSADVGLIWETRREDAQVRALMPSGIGGIA